ncbi:hypothetical protein BTZ20_3343 [Rhodococcus sp. MTM3W5.2]|nr:hypothetical protein BTZ20_3343 [Rhodococcus sp. MTM3W5.2]
MAGPRHARVAQARRVERGQVVVPVDPIGGADPGPDARIHDKGGQPQSCQQWGQPPSVRPQGARGYPRAGGSGDATGHPCRRAHRRSWG